MRQFVVIENYAARGRSWWLDRSERERLLLTVLGALAAVAFVLFVVVRPLQAARAKALADIRTYETLTAGLRAAGPDLGRRPALAGGTPTTIITGSAATAGLTIQRIEPEGAATRVVIEEASYDTIVAWLAELERSGGIRVAEARLDRRPAPGMVGAQLLLAQ